MKSGIFYITIIFCLINNAVGMEPSERISILGESMENGSASSLGVYSEGIFYAGISLNYITSSTAIQSSNRKTIYPVYLAIGFRGPWKLSPYIEAGADIVELLIDGLLNDEFNSTNELDYYYSSGLEFSATDRLSISLYAKKYNFSFHENLLAPITNSSPNSYGVGIIIRF